MYGPDAELLAVGPCETTGADQRATVPQFKKLSFMVQVPLRTVEVLAIFLHPLLKISKNIPNIYATTLVFKHTFKHSWKFEMQQLKTN